jgi:hypothetical protein
MAPSADAVAQKRGPMSEPCIKGCHQIIQHFRYPPTLLPPRIAGLWYVGEDDMPTVLTVKVTEDRAIRYEEVHDAPVCLLNALAKYLAQ